MYHTPNAILTVVDYHCLLHTLLVEHIFIVVRVFLNFTVVRVSLMKNLL